MSDPPQPSLEYQVPPPPVSRWQVRLLLFLVLIQVVMTAQSTYAPGIMQWVQARWAEHQAAVARRAQIRQNVAAVQGFLSFARPTGMVIWDEDPKTAAPLLAASGYHEFLPEDAARDFLAENVPPGAVADMPAALPVEIQTAISGSRPYWYSGLVFMHGRKAGNQDERLVMVAVTGTLHTSTTGGPHGASETFDGTIWKSQTFTATSCGTHSEDGTLVFDCPSTTELMLQPAAGDPTDMPAHWQASTRPSMPGSLRIRYYSQLRVLAGEMDPADTSHFTIAYQFDGKPGIIDGYLMPDGRVQLKPRQGIVQGNHWYPAATTDSKR